MYPNLYYAFKDLFNIDWKPLRFINSFGFFVALAFILGALTLAAEFKRKGKQGLLQPTEINVVVGKPATITELLLNFLLGFLLGYKILALFIMDSSVTNDPQAFIFSGLGSWPAGIILGLLFAGIKWWEKNKQKLPKPELRKIRFWPHDRVGEITIIALIFGLLGAKLFDIFENWSAFLKEPSSFIFSPAGLTFYGGLICAALAIWFYARKHKIGFWHLNDAAAPALMLAYAIGRIGCQVSGDGDWGIYNSAYVVDTAGKVIPGNVNFFNQSLFAHGQFFLSQFSRLDAVPHLSLAKPSFLQFLPDWVFAYNFPHNVNDTGIPIEGCIGKYCNQLPAAVFPTSLYETVICLILFFILWSLRKKLKVPGTLFAIYLMMNGIERFSIEKIRVNNRLDFLGFHPTQAEVISTLLFLAGLILFIVLRRKGSVKSHNF
jgi:phosphatidylglycerol---prolipoprotein diacylglyceryl transferase